jgi:hypothetical protein
MTQQQSPLLGQILKVYLLHLFSWVKLQLDRPLASSNICGHAAIVDSDMRTLEQYIRNALTFTWNIMCTSKGATALAAIA